MWALSLAYWLHMLATIVWIGGLASLAWVILPAAKSTLNPVTYAGFLDSVQKKLDPLSWGSLVVLLATGMFQMSGNQNYEGFLSISNTWSAAILLKHVVFFGMMGISAYLTWGILPALRRQAFLRAHGKASAGDDALQRREAWLLRLNLILGIVVLALTAVARVS